MFYVVLLCSLFECSQPFHVLETNIARRFNEQDMAVTVFSSLLQSLLHLTILNLLPHFFEENINLNFIAQLPSLLLKNFKLSLVHTPTILTLLILQSSNLFFNNPNLLDLLPTITILTLPISNHY